jgi:hypothetical protein
MVTTITPTIVNLNVIETIAPSPSQLQQSGAIVSCGGTTLTAGMYQYCGSLSAVTALAVTPVAITTLTWSSGIATATVPAMTLAVGQTFKTTISGAAPAGYDGTYIATVATSTTFTYALTTNPGTETSLGTYTPPYSAFVTLAATTFFAQGSSAGVYVLELGPETTPTAGITALGTWITANSNPQIFYAYLLDGTWDGSALATLAANYASPNGRTYFFVTSTTGTIADYSPSKSVYANVPSPNKPVTEHTVAADFYQWLVNAPSAATPAAPMAYRYVYGATAWPTNNSSVNTVLTAYANLIYAGSEGGVANACIFKGTTMDGAQSMSWYGVDWFAIGVKQALANAIINGSNQNPPLLYNQQGINTLLTVAQDYGNTAVAFGLAQSVTVSATPFATYVAQNPSNYAAGIYNGFSAAFITQNGFLTISFNIDAIEFA